MTPSFRADSGWSQIIECIRDLLNLEAERNVDGSRQLSPDGLRCQQQTSRPFSCPAEIYKLAGSESLFYLERGHAAIRPRTSAEVKRTEQNAATQPWKGTECEADLLYKLNVIGNTKGRLAILLPDMFKGTVGLQFTRKRRQTDVGHRAAPFPSVSGNLSVAVRSSSKTCCQSTVEGFVRCSCNLALHSTMPQELSEDHGRQLLPNAGPFRFSCCMKR